MIHFPSWRFSALVLIICSSAAQASGPELAKAATDSIGTMMRAESPNVKFACESLLSILGDNTFMAIDYPPSHSGTSFEIQKELYARIGKDFTARFEIVKKWAQDSALEVNSEPCAHFFT